MTTASVRKVTPKAASKSARKGDWSGTLADLVVERETHPLRGLSAFYWISAWGLFYDANDREPRNAEEVSKALSISVRTLYRWQSCFRQVFPELSTPATIWAQVRGQVPGSADPHVLGLQIGAAEL